MRAEIGVDAGNHTGRMSEAQPSQLPTLGIIAGSGRLPLQLVETCRSTGRPFFIITFENATDSATFKNMPHAVVRLGAVGEALAHLRSAGATELVLAGRISRPSLGGLRPDMVGAKLLAKLGASFFSGDDALLRSVVAFLEGEGFKVVGANQVTHDLLAPYGQLGKVVPDNRCESDIVKGFQVAKRLGELDVGQSVIVENGYVLGVEAAEGTDALIERCKGLKREIDAGVLVKICKPGQESRVDLPAIGPSTIEKIAACGFKGIAVEASASIILDKAAVIARADELGIFILGVKS